MQWTVSICTHSDTKILRQVTSVYFIPEIHTTLLVFMFHNLLAQYNCETKKQKCYVYYSKL